MAVPPRAGLAREHHALGTAQPELAQLLQALLKRWSWAAEPLRRRSVPPDVSIAILHIKCTKRRLSCSTVCAHLEDELPLQLERGADVEHGAA